MRGPMVHSWYNEAEMTKASRQIYDAQKLAKFFGVSRETVRDWCKTGKLPAFKIGKEWKVRVEDLQKLINQKVKTRERAKQQEGMF